MNFVITSMNGVVGIDIFYALWFLNYLFRHWSVTLWCCKSSFFIVVIVFFCFKKVLVLYLDFQSPVSYFFQKHDARFELGLTILKPN